MLKVDNSFEIWIRLIALLNISLECTYHLVYSKKKTNHFCFSASKTACL